MLRIHQSTEIAQAESYYTEALAREDYYIDGQEIEGVSRGPGVSGGWAGRGAALLGLTGPVTAEAFKRLCRNQHPTLDEPLTARTKDGRTVGYDFNFHTPKGVSLLHALTGDARIRSEFEHAVAASMKRMEEEMQTRVRLGGEDANRTTGNLVWGSFTHLTARPVAGVPDPHLHVHCFVFNATWDAMESRWKAGQFQNLKRDAPYFEAAFHMDLAERLTKLGYPVERRPSITGEGRMGWDVACVSPEVVAKFSARTSEIESIAKEKGIRDAAEKAELGARTREKKRPEQTVADLKRAWESRVSSEELRSIRSAAEEARTNPSDARRGQATDRSADRLVDRAAMEEAARDALSHATTHVFERVSVIPERRMLEEAMRHGVGRTTESQIDREAGRWRFLSKDVDGQKFVTTPEVLAEEKAMLDFAREGRGSCVPLGQGFGGRGGVAHVIADPRVASSPGQRAAVEHVLSSQDRVMAIRGAAGTGKTTLMQEAVKGIEAGGSKVFVFAPTAEAARGVLRRESFTEADTVASLFTDPRWKSRIKDQVLWVDEAGLMSTKAMKALFSLAKDANARVILSGDTKQHSSVERGDALRALERLAGIRPAEVTAVKRQSGVYREAVESIAKGDLAGGFATLDELGWIKEVKGEARAKGLAEAYLSTPDPRKNALVVSPIHKEAESVTRLIREGLKSRGLITGTEQKMERLVDRHWTASERRDPLNYKAGDVVVFHKATGKIRANETLRVVATDAHGPDPPRVVVERTSGERMLLPISKPERFGVFDARSIDIASGDALRITRNGTTLDGKHRLNNGATYTVTKITREGNLVLDNGWTVSKQFKHLAHGYCSTSHASQGKTVNRVFIAQSAESFVASSAEQFYVSVSRGKQQAVIFTDDKQGLLKAVGQSRARLTASELVLGMSLQKKLLDRVLMNQRTRLIERSTARSASRSVQQQRVEPTRQTRTASPPERSRGFGRERER